MFNRNARVLFDQAADAYDKARPGYPEELIDQLVNLEPPARGSESARILEIGCGTGQITRPLASRGYHMVAIELGEQLSRIARQNLADYPHVQIIHHAFETWNSTGHPRFDLVVSAQAFHWIEPELGYPKIHSLLKKQGHLAVVYNLFRGGTGPVYQDLAQIYRRYFPQSERENASARLQSMVDRTIRMIEECGLFQDPVTWSCPWVETYSTDRHLQLLESFSDHRALEARVRQTLFREIRAVIDKHGGTIERPLQATLLLAQIA